VSANPAVGIAFVNVLNPCSICLTYHLGTAMFGPPVGLIASGLYAVFPTAVLSGKELWNTGFIPFFPPSFSGRSGACSWRADHGLWLLCSFCSACCRRSVWEEPFSSCSWMEHASSFGFLFF
jgi:hypothetical protein